MVLLYIRKGYLFREGLQKSLADVLVAGVM